MKPDSKDITLDDVPSANKEILYGSNVLSKTVQIFLLFPYFLSQRTGNVNTNKYFSKKYFSKVVTPACHSKILLPFQMDQYFLCAT